MLIVETTRLLLRQPQEADARPLVNIHQDPEVVKKGQVTLTAPLGGVEAGIRNVNRMLRHIRPDNPTSHSRCAEDWQRFERVGMNPINGETVRIYGVRRAKKSSVGFVPYVR